MLNHQNGILREMNAVHTTEKSLFGLPLSTRSTKLHESEDLIVYACKGKKEKPCQCQYATKIARYKSLDGSVQALLVYRRSHELGVMHNHERHSVQPKSGKHKNLALTIEQRQYIVNHWGEETRADIARALMLAGMIVPAQKAVVT